MDANARDAVDVTDHEDFGAEREPSRDELAREYGALRSSALLVNRSARARTTFSGGAAAEVLTGLVTNDVTALSRGQGQYAAALTAKGKIVTDLRIFARDQDFLVDAPARAAAGWWNLVRKFVNPRLSKYADVGDTLHDVGVFGIAAATIVAASTGERVEDLGELSPYGHRVAARNNEPVLIARVPDAGVPGFEIFAAPEVLRALVPVLVARGALPGSLAAFDIARIEAGRPEWGVDMDDTTLAQEANLDELHAISYTKGCYTGQETVARLHFRGHVNRYLRGLRFDGGVVPAHGAELVEDATSRVVGDVRSAAISPRLGGVALAMIRREIDPGGWLTARWEHGTVRVNVVDLPISA